MKTCTYFAAWLLAWSAATLQADEAPVVFARSGQAVTVQVGGEDKTNGPVALWAFGQRMGEPLTVKDNAIELVAPKVRVPLVFRLCPAGDANTVFRELVVYPDKPISWDEDVQRVAVGIPEWFDTWSKAMRLPLTTLKDQASFNGGNWRDLKSPGLLILGKKAAGKNAAAIQRLAVEHKTNVLVLEADWFGEIAVPKRPFAVVPRQMVGALADWQGQQWALPPTFRHGASPWPGISNRQTWIAGVEHPLVEEIRSPQMDAGSLRVVLSYLPWRDQLGRCEMADELLLRLLAETAKVARDRQPLISGWCLLHPTAKEIKNDERPVLAAALKSAETMFSGDGAEEMSCATRKVLARCLDRHLRDCNQAISKYNEMRGYVLDLRGKAPPPKDLFQRRGGMEAFETRIGMNAPLLILGDNPILDTWKWLELDRANHRSPRPGVLWWPDNSLPPSMESQLRLMQLFTEWKISLGDIPQEASNEDRKNEP